MFLLMCTDVGYFDRAVLTLTNALDASLYSYDLAVTTIITALPAGALVAGTPQAGRGVRAPAGTPRAHYLRAAPAASPSSPTPGPSSPSSGASTCANAAAAQCPQTQCYGSSSCCYASGDCGKSDTNVCGAINLQNPNGSPTSDCPTPGSCMTAATFPPAGASKPAAVHSSNLNDGCSCPSAVASCTTGQCWGRMTCDNATTSSCTTTNMCLGNSAGGRDNTAPVGGFCQQNGASSTYKFCPMAVGVRAPTQTCVHARATQCLHIYSCN
jgi:hypothetical protein